MPPQFAELGADAKSAWRRMWLRHLLALTGYLGVFLGLYVRMQHRIADHDIFFWEQRILSRRLLLVMALHLAVMLIWHRRMWLTRWRQFIAEPYSPYNLAFVRIVLFGTMLIDCMFTAPKEWLPIASLPCSARQPLPFVGWMIEALPISQGLYQLALGLAILALILAIFGLFTRPAMLALIPLMFYIYGVPQFFGKLSHYQFFVWLTILLAFSPCFEAWSIDGIFRRIRGVRIDRKPSARYGLAIKWLMLTLAGIYFFSGVRKLYEAGLFWALSDNPVNLLRTEWLEQFGYLPAIRIDRWPILCSLAAAGVIVFELAYPFLLFSKRGRLGLAIEAILFHNLNGYFLKIDFAYLKTAHLGYFDWGKIRAWLQKRPRWLAWLCILAAIVGLGRWVGMWFLIPSMVLGAIIDLSWRAFPLRKRVGWLLNLGRKLPAPPTQDRATRQRTRWHRWSVGSAILLIGLNSVCGLFGIHSWPFSAYPTYSFVRGSTMEYGWFIPQTPTGEVMDLDTEAQAAEFRKENILPMAERIVVNYKYYPDQLISSIQACWLRWQTEVPRLQRANSAAVVIRTYPLDPDHSQHYQSETPLGRLELRGSEWIFVQAVADSMPLPSP